MALTIVYPALFHHEDSGFWVEFPDLDGCLTQGDNAYESLENAREALAGYYVSRCENNLPIPPATPIEKITVSEDAFVQLVDADLLPFSRSVKKTLTIPSWLNDAAEARSINFSQVLQRALREQLEM